MPVRLKPPIFELLLLYLWVLVFFDYIFGSDFQSVRSNIYGAAGVKPSVTPPPASNFCLCPISRWSWKDSLMTPTQTTPLQASFIVTPLPSPPLPPNKNFDRIYTLGHAPLPMTNKTAHLETVLA